LWVLEKRLEALFGNALFVQMSRYLSHFLSCLSSVFYLTTKHTKEEKHKGHRDLSVSLCVKKLSGLCGFKKNE